MAIQSIKDVADAYSQGRWHTQRFLKNAGLAGDGAWQDWSYASGQPAFDARIGDALTLTPMVATRNDAIWFPPVGTDMERKLAGLRVYCTAGGTGQLSVEFQMYDLLAVYPLIDGDSTDPQAMDNTALLPRYADGVGVKTVLVSHVAPALSQANFTINYTDADDTSRSMTGITTVNNVGIAAWNLGGTVTCPLYLPSDGRGVKQIDDITFASAPGGLWCIYMVKPLCAVHWRGGLASVTQTVMTEKCLCAEDGFRMPRIYDGAWLGFFYMPNGSARTVASYGTATFIWG
jgi:hypothetical protein